MTTINPAGVSADRKPPDPRLGYYVANFTDYRFLQVFYPAHGILAWYSRATGRLQAAAGRR